MPNHWRVEAIARLQEISGMLSGAPNVEAETIQAEAAETKIESFGTGDEGEGEGEDPIY